MRLGAYVLHTPTWMWFRVTGWLLRYGVGYVCGVTDDGIWAYWPAEESYWPAEECARVV